LTLAPGLLALALLSQPQSHTYYWRDAAGQTHITNTPPPADAQTLEPPPPPAVEPGQAGRPEVIRQSESRGGQQKVVLTPAQMRAWGDLDRTLAKARAEYDGRTVAAVTESLIQNCLWGNGLWVLTLAPFLAITLMGLLGWWLSFGLAAGLRLPLLSGFLLVGLGLGQLLLTVFLYHPQAIRLRQNLELLEAHNGSGHALRPDQRALLQKRYQAVEQATEFLQAPWRFPAEVQSLRQDMNRVMFEP
jgi:hypothetical protein